MTEKQIATLNKKFRRAKKVFFKQNPGIVSGEKFQQFKDEFLKKNKVDL
jgi:hypothetical protein